MEARQQAYDDSALEDSDLSYARGTFPPILPSYYYYTLRGVGPLTTALGSS